MISVLSLLGLLCFPPDCPPARELLAEAPVPGREEDCHCDSSVLAVFYLVRTGLEELGQYVKRNT